MTHQGSAPNTAAVPLPAADTQERVALVVRTEVVIHVVPLAVLEPHQKELRLSLSTPGLGVLLRARFPLALAQPRALPLLLEAIVAWFGMPLRAALDADAEDVRRHPEFWSRFLSETDSPQISVEWVSVPLPNRRDPFVADFGSSRRARKLIAAAEGKR